MRRARPTLDIDALTQHEERRLVEHVFLDQAAGASRAVLFTGVGHGVGCSHVCARSSRVVAEESAAPVCAVDAAMRPSLHEHFGAERGPGWSDALVEPGPIRTFARRVAPQDLWLVPGGLRDRDLPLDEVRQRLQSRLADLRADFRYVLIDAPPAGRSVEAAMLASLADGVVLVLEAHVTAREVARHAKESLAAAGARLLGTVLNKRTFPIPDVLYCRS
jgi:Mrp family chromosome partitioning ATPase